LLLFFQKKEGRFGLQAQGLRACPSPHISWEALMSFYELINKKKRGGELSREEIRFAVTGFICGEIPDCQMSAFLMAVYFCGMTADETAEFTMAMAESGEQIDLAGIRGKFGVTADKHSTGGVGDKTTLAVVPIVAACGVPVAKMSGRGLGHTGGTADKLEAIPGLRMDLCGEEFMRIVEKHGACIATQSANLAPADKKIYALRDITATVDSLPLIAASVMSKKIAAGADAILLDVKAGSGAFMKTPEDARALAQAMVDIGMACGRKTAALITNMYAPLGYAIGNSLEIIEVMHILSEKIPVDALPVSQNLITLCEELSAAMLLIAGKGDGCLEQCRRMVKNAIASGAALKKLADIIDNERLIEHDTEMEIEIRAGMIYAIELIKDELLIQGVEMSSAQIDNVLWRASKTGDFKQSAKPYHLTKTIDY